MRGQVADSLERREAPMIDMAVFKQFQGANAHLREVAQLEATGADTAALSCASCRLDFMAGDEVEQAA